ncbi:ATP-binding cassette domain-containing protein [Actinotignum sanguinis]|uniref:ATP-binding cassette domain-containing protein n=2 Tax=Actinomycetaceae TaxID=2049 RepID=A0ABZ0RE00_9ACTO|nr:ATP-binding cassette domain-containing protein [Actinotignum sanguinis]WPJ89240.1 ATP-binding cassette domain-containing protein [Schaalia turicensis]MDE1656653.1 ATP-binding cassette domain-containing protein [Actinotignum sanguinis]MDK7198345.1 ATP-binding cassette domain-containing protein [Actinotignum sanguinis]MDK8513445.1 ATP-binding cassette domain-containing protein [Actinotignum sanguinis]MDK8519786.1 ATP-binding cassette domain-containing protein [Actinotignum sanguinis]
MVDLFSAAGGPAGALVAEHLSFAYGSHRVLHDVSITAQPGRVLGVLGPNGTGKSTLLSLLAGDQAPTSGQVRIGGTSVSSLSWRELAHMRAVMPQNSTFPFAYLVRDLVAMGLGSGNGAGRGAGAGQGAGAGSAAGAGRGAGAGSAAGAGRSADAAIIDAALHAADVTHLQDRDVTRLSGGEQARVTFARVLAQRAGVVLLDEPTAALDISHQQRLLELCRRLAAGGHTVVAVLHDIQLAGALCDDVVLLRHGRVEAAGTPRQVLTSELLTRVYDWPIRVETLGDGTIVVVPTTATTSVK